jgi:hypothetical protein
VRIAVDQGGEIAEAIGRLVEHSAERGGGIIQRARDAGGIELAEPGMPIGNQLSRHDDRQGVPTVIFVTVSPPPEHDVERTAHGKLLSVQFLDSSVNE